MALNRVYLTEDCIKWIIYSDVYSVNCEFRVVVYYSIRVRLYKIILMYIYGVYGRMTCHSNTKSVLQKI